MFKIICITNRRLCPGDFLAQLDRTAAARPAAIILREKDMPEEKYLELARQALKICGRYGTECILHSYPQEALAAGGTAIHLPLAVLRDLDPEVKARFRLIGASCHSPEDAVEAAALGASYVTAGHVFATDCKKGLAPRGLDFLRETCRAVNIPVYAIGGIGPENIRLCKEAGAVGACSMSGFMQAADPAEYLESLRRGLVA